ncbi:Flavoredoxin [hydrothermal vent metagenome]|uniref:Flavoredoxin n=1 Tax=hydrothermal vent metagenome TaxID=652676 RepID=A0A3B0VL56_9ZZZZ
MSKLQLDPNTTLYPVPVVLVTCGTGDDVNVFTLNRIASCNAEPPMVSISVRPSRASHNLIDQSGEFVVNIPWSEMELVGDYVGTTSSREIDKWQETGLTVQPAAVVAPPLLDACPVNLECQVRYVLHLSSHTLFVAEVVMLHAHPSVLNDRQEVDFQRAGTGIAYRAAVVRERPADNFKPDDLRRQIHVWRDSA